MTKAERAILAAVHAWGAERCGVFETNITQLRQTEMRLYKAWEHAERAQRASERRQRAKR